MLDLVRLSRIAAAVASAILAFAGEAVAAGTTSCATGAAPTVNCPQPAVFHTYRSGTRNVDLRWRDAEFAWDALYAGGLSATVKTTLDRFARNSAESLGTSVIATNGRNIQTIYNYLNREGRTWSSNPVDQTAMRLGNIAAYSAADRCHSDAYIAHPSRDGGGRYPSCWQTDTEDTSSGHPPTEIRPENAIHFGGPADAAISDPTGTGWTRPGSRQFINFNHEMTHSMPQNRLDIATNPIDELWSAAAEIVGGISDTTTAGAAEVPYTWSLLAHVDPSSSGPDPGQPSFNTRYSRSNYQGRTAFMAYCLFNFLNADTNRTLAGMQDDLVYKWNRSPLGDFGPAGLRALLTDANCATCAGKNYFHPGGVALDPISRLDLLHHNWRVSNFVNNPTLEEGQYGYPAWGKFTPSQHVKAWQDFDGTSKDDIVALPAIVELGPSAVTRETTFVGSRSFRAASHPLTLTPYSANYWVIRATSPLQTQNRDLVVRISPRAMFSCLAVAGSTGGDVRLMASAMAYDTLDATGDRSILWSKPARAVFTTSVGWVDADSLAGDLELVIPQFGLSRKAVVVVITLADGPTGQFAVRGSSAGYLAATYLEAMPYRLDLSLRTIPSQSQLPVALSALAGTDDYPSWSPLGDQLAYSAQNAAVSSYAQIYRRKLDGSAPVRLVAQNVNQFCPDWSPRNDFVVFENGPGGGESSLQLADANLTGGSATQLTTLPGCETLPAFQPNGRGIAYIHQSGPTTFALRWIAVDGTGDRLISTLSSAPNSAPRWSPTGGSILLYDTAAQQLRRYPFAGGAGTLEPMGPLALNAFDPSPGAGRMAVSLATPVRNMAKWATCTGASDLAAARVALVDTSMAKRDTAFRHVARGTGGLNPRWSPDGTMLAFSREKLSNSDRDIFTSRVTWNRAPAFQSLDDHSSPACISFEIDLAATDPDGEPLTYSGAYMPQSSVITNGHIFRWQYPQVGEYYTVFRASDPSGGVASKVVKITIYDDGSCDNGLTAGGGGGGGSSMREVGALQQLPGGGSSLAGANSLLDGQAPQAWAQQSCRVAEVGIDAPASSDLTLRSLGAWASEVDRAALRVVDHPAGTLALSDGANVHVGALVAAPAVTGTDGADFIALMALADENGAFLAQGSALTLTRAATGGAQSLVLDCRRGGDRVLTPGAGLLVEAFENGAWTTLGRIQPRQDWDRLALAVPAGEGALRITAAQDVSLREVAFLAEAASADRTDTMVEPSISGDEAATAALRAEGGGVMPLDAVTARTLTFTLPERGEGRARTTFLEVRARHVAGSSQAGATRSQPDALPRSVALHAAVPNPFNRTTTLAFDVPSRAAVALEVFDAQGRRVRTLFKGVTSPGSYNRTWDGTDANGRVAAPGVYMARLVVGEQRLQRRLVLAP